MGDSLKCYLTNHLPKVLEFHKSHLMLHYYFKNHSPKIIGLLSGTAYTISVLTLIPAWISNYIHYKVWDEITYPFLNFNGATVEV